MFNLLHKMNFSFRVGGLPVSDKSPTSINYYFMRIIYFFLMLFFAISANAQLALVKRNGLFGYIDRTTKEVIPCTYAEAEPMVEGIALVRKYKNKNATYLNDRYLSMFIDSTGKMLFPQKFSYAHPFHQNRAAVFNGKFWGFINRQGKLVIPYIYNDANYFNEGFAVVKDKNYDLIVIDSMGKMVSKKPLLKADENEIENLPEVYENHIVLYKTGEGMGLVDVFGNIKVPYQYQWYDNLNPPVSEVRYGTWQAYGAEKGFVVYDTTGKVVLPVSDEMYFDMRDGLRYIKDTISKTEDRFEFIDNKNNIVISSRIYSSMDFNISSNHVNVSQGDKYGFLHKNGKLVIPCEYEYANGWVYNNFFAVVKDNLWQVVDSSNNVVLSTNYKRRHNPPEYNDKDFRSLSTAMAHHNLYVLEGIKNYLIIDNKQQVIKTYTILSPYNNELANFDLKNGDEGYITVHNGIVYEMYRAKNSYGKPVSKRKPGVLYYDFVSGFNATWRANLSVDGDLLQHIYW